MQEIELFEVSEEDITIHKRQLSRASSLIVRCESKILELEKAIKKIKDVKEEDVLNYLYSL